ITPKTSLFMIPQQAAATTELPGKDSTSTREPKPLSAIFLPALNFKPPNRIRKHLIRNSLALVHSESLPHSILMNPQTVHLNSQETKTKQRPNKRANGKAHDD